MPHRPAGIAIITALAISTASAPSKADDRTSPELLVVVETGRPVRPWELPPDSVPYLPPPKPLAEPPTRSSASVARAPLPDEADGVSHAESRTTGEKLKVVPRALLLVPRLAIEVIGAPIRGGLYAYDRYEVQAHVRDILWNDSGTMGVYPVFGIETDYAINAGARFVHRDLFGEREKLSFRASFGGVFWQQYNGSLTSGDRFGRLQLEARAEYEILPREHFFGIGNGDEVDMAPAPIDPYSDPTAIDTRFRQRVARAYGRARLRIVGPLSVRLISGVIDKTFERSSKGDIPAGTDIAEHYQVDELTAWDEGTTYSYNELELRYDSRHNGDQWEPVSVPSTGWLAAGFGGVALGFAGVPTHYWVYGGDVQRFIRLGENPRVLTLRVIAQEVRGETDEIPFVDLPRLGGPILLRGYERDRFRDRAMALGSAEYLWDLGRGWAAFAFSDAGRVYPSLADFTFEDLRVGFGGGLEFHSDRSFLGRFNVASSIDGGVFFSLSLDPVYVPSNRVERD